ncbi:unnamed protein product [Phytophthora fragariaefolia]|uniref:Unnamed protein product n=1 Tax=Phytophthora fragariaefolia TaxID=1490495 RepID=A0A9W6XXH9_9STRA|nr:unnamed protein product [Phytophthora fragariaefolia]
MALTRKDLLDHVEMKPEGAAKRETETRKAADFNAMAVISKLLSPVYQSMIRECKSAKEQLHEFQMTSGTELMDHLLKFDDLCLRLSAVGDKLNDDEKLVTLLGSLSSEYDVMVKIIEAHSSVTLMDAKEMLRGESETLKKREKQEEAFNVSARGVHGGGRRRNTAGSRRTQTGQHGHGADTRGSRRDKQGQSHGCRGASKFNGRCFECNRLGHERSECPKLSKRDDGDEFVFAATREASTTWLLDSGASTHMTHGRQDFVEFRELQSPTDILVAEVLYVPDLDRRLLSIPSLVAKGASVEFSGDGCTISFEGRLVARVEKRDKLFVWNVVETTDEERMLDGRRSIGGAVPWKFGARATGSCVEDEDSVGIARGRWCSKFCSSRGRTGRRIRCLRSDNGGEYVNKKFGDFFAAHGIVHQPSVPYTPQENGLAERMNRTLVEMTQLMLYHRGMAREWRGEALRTAVNLRVFGSRGFVHVEKSRRSKWDARAHACNILGYAAGSEAYRVWDVEDERLDDDANLVQQQPIVPVTDNGCDTDMADVDDDPVDMEVDTVPNTLVQSQHDGHEMSRRGEEERTIPVSASIPDPTAARQLTNQASLLQSALVP